MKKVFAGLAVSSLLFMAGCAAEEPSVPEETTLEEDTSFAKHRWVQDVWLFNSVSYFLPDGTLEDVTDAVLQRLASETPTETKVLLEGTAFNVFESLAPTMVDGAGSTRDDVTMTAGLMSFDEEEVFAVIATPDEEAEAPIGIEDFLELDLTFLGDSFKPGAPMSFDFTFMQSLPGEDPAGLSPLDLLQHRMQQEQINFYGHEAADGAELLMFSDAMGVAVKGSTRMKMSGKGKISDPGLGGFKKGVWGARGGGPGGVKKFFKNFGKGAKGSNDLINCNLGGSCNPPPPKEKPKKKCYFFCGKVSGDPHLVTLDGLAYDAQAVGEFQLLKSPELSLQMRTEPMGSSRTISLLTGVALEAYGQKFTVAKNEGKNELFINNELVDLQDAEESQNVGEIKVSYSKSEVVFETPADGLFSVLIHASQLGLFADPGNNAPLSGMLGDGDGDPENDLKIRGGAALPAHTARSDSTRFYGDFVNSWRITEADSHFAYHSGQSTAHFEDLTFPDEHVSLDAVPESELGLARAVCEKAGVKLSPFNDHCIFDFWASGDMNFVLLASQMDLLTGISTGEYILADDEGSDEDGDETMQEGQWPEGHGPEEGQSAEAYVVSKWNYNPHSRYWGGDKFDHFCPAGGKVNAEVWGGGKEGYTSDSAVCVAAVHSGIITEKSGGLLHVEMLEGSPSYPAATAKNGVVPNDWLDSWSSGFIFN